MKSSAVTLVINRETGQFLTPFVGLKELVIQCVRCERFYSTPVCGCVIETQRLKVSAMQNELQTNLLRPRIA